jgi:glycine cleavage system H lipoate-binding protein
MTVILMLMTFVVFLVAERVINKHEVPVMAKEAREGVAPRLQPAMVAGYKVPVNLRYHQGHTWAVSESPNLVRVGIDDFAAKLIGEVEAVQTPTRGQWVRQGQKVFAFRHNGELIELVSPIEGTIADVNDNLAKNPEMAINDNYGDGWLVTVTAPDAKTNYRNLMGGTLARWFTEEAATRLRTKIPTLAAATATMHDGGEAHLDLSKEIPADKYAETVQEFFLG